MIANAKEIIIINNNNNNNNNENFLMEGSPL